MQWYSPYDWKQKSNKTEVLKSIDPSNEQYWVTYLPHEKQIDIKWIEDENANLD